MKIKMMTEGCSRINVVCALWVWLCRLRNETKDICTNKSGTNGFEKAIDLPSPVVPIWLLRISTPRPPHQRSKHAQARRASRVKPESSHANVSCHEQPTNYLQCYLSVAATSISSISSPNLYVEQLKMSKCT